MCQAGYTGDGKYCMASQLGIQGLPPCKGPINLNYMSQNNLPLKVGFEFSAERLRIISIIGISISVQPLGCDVLKNCDANAQCVYDSHTNTHKCECYEGYDFFSK